MNTKEYNGYTNYETWLVALWYGESPEWMKEYYIKHGASDTADRFKEDVEEWANASYNDILDGASLYADLLNTAIGMVDWYEIVEAWSQDGEWDKEQDDEQDDEEGEEE